MNWLPNWRYPWIRCWHEFLRMQSLETPYSRALPAHWLGEARQRLILRHGVSFASPLAVFSPRANLFTASYKTLISGGQHGFEYSQ